MPLRRWEKLLNLLANSLFASCSWGDSSSGPLIPYIQVRSVSELVLCFSATLFTNLLSFSPQTGALPRLVYRRLHALRWADGWFPHSELCLRLVEQQVWTGSLFPPLPPRLSGEFELTFPPRTQGKIIVGGACLQTLAYGLLIAAFPAFPVIYAVGGLGLAIQDAMANTYIASLPVGAEQKLSYLHASYGLVRRFLLFFPFPAEYSSIGRRHLSSRRNRLRIIGNPLRQILLDQYGNRSRQRPSFALVLLSFFSLILAGS
jgi:hypothetical protein